MRSSKRRRKSVILFAIALYVMPMSSKIIFSSTPKAIYTIGACLDDDDLRDVGTIYGGGAGVLGALSILCGVQLAVGVGIGL